MSNRLTRLYTRKGDRGSTGLANGTRVAKTHPRIEALGDVDELNSLIGLLAAGLSAGDPLQPELSKIQNELFDLGGELAVADPQYQVINAVRLEALEEELDLRNETLPPLKEFILPGGNRSAAEAHLARSVCRRAERRMVELAASETVNALAIAYLNRLSDLLFVYARLLARRDNGSEVYWRPTQPESVNDQEKSRNEDHSADT
ncbi:MAG: ATP:cob(I)alamin adenosyltransferase [Oceanospirillaceae bacterium]|uniref:cob(I)yrinic acid a,c-diamide adenosyltransferase n=1 Tax=Marinobacterium litorale TaxID=404770 RepID=UPI000413CE48|nr:cob(I)yrinic acid a,c-diamide adenosyltransferase [Marinobacterium litorale]MBT00299.1 ATP:cob(I)alamin adenosyltransferase [Oceanospirillaceae bacterium]